MAITPRVFNLTRQYFMKPKRAVQGVDNCAYAWVEFGVSVRDLTLTESITARNQQAKMREGLVYFVEGKDGKPVAKPYMAELPGMVYRPAEKALAATRQGYELVRAANQFAALQV